MFALAAWEQHGLGNRRLRSEKGRAQEKHQWLCGLKTGPLRPGLPSGSQWCGVGGAYPISSLGTCVPRQLSHRKIPYVYNKASSASVGSIRAGRAVNSRAWNSLIETLIYCTWKGLKAKYWILDSQHTSSLHAKGTPPNCDICWECLTRSFLHHYL